MAGNRDRKVVVCYVPELLKHRAKERYAARMRALGLTAYGRTPDEAQERVEELFSAFVNWYRSIDRIEEVLNRSGIEWHWQDEYQGDVPVKDVSDLTHGQVLSRQPSAEEGKFAIDEMMVSKAFGESAQRNNEFVRSRQATANIARGLAA